MKTNKKPVEVFKVLPAYQTVSKKRKLAVLKILQVWVEREILKNS